jgi:leucyl-tRNA synthetase
MAKAKKGSGIKMENFGAMEKKWQKAWESADAYKSSDSSGGKKCYVCEMFPYPSASFLHVGHMRNYTIGDSVARYKRMRGFNVMYPMGFDAFGLPAENAAIKNKVHPKKYTDVAIKTIKGYMKELGLSYDWSREIATCSPEYYKWNQWLFLRMLEKGIAYRKKAPVNWCPSCKTVLANEEVIDGKCWRCSSEVTIEQLEQWFLKITGYADELLEGLNGLNWPERVKELQRNWIGRREGVRVVFPIKGSEKTLEVFTTRVDTLYGVTFVACAVQHQVVAGLVKRARREVSAYR